MTIWHGTPALEALNAMNANTLMAHHAVVFTAIGDDTLTAEMPIDARAVQPYRIMHGGASAMLAETVGSVAAILTLDAAQSRAVGLSLTINHLRPVPEGGRVSATARPQHIGRSTQVWQIDIQDQDGRKVSLATLTVAVITAR
jgi:1,4-dihydroxy-2-naphthoyl-CoA hydrolase